MSNPSAKTVHDERAAIPGMMRAVVASGYGGPEVLSVQQVDTPQPGEGEVLVRVEASSLNALDWHMRTGTPYFLRLMEGLRHPKRTIDGADVAGTVVAVGGGVDQLSVGDAVFGEINGGGFAEYVAAPARLLVSKPAEVGWDAAGALGVAGLTALQGLRTHAAVQPGDRVLVNGAAGGVGTFAVQIARALGAEVTAVCSTRNVEMVRSIGADRVIDYTTEDFLQSGSMFDVVFDGVGNRSARAIRRVMAPEGRFVLISGPKSNPWLDPIPHMVKSRLGLIGASQSFHQFTAASDRDDLTFLGALAAAGQVEPQIQRVVGLDGVADGLAEIGSGHVRSKIVVRPAAPATAVPTTAAPATGAGG